MWSAGQKVGNYEIIAKLREGGMATLYLARQTGPSGSSRHVAIKVIHPRLASDEQFRQMFLDEAMLASRIEHPNVVRVEELGQYEHAHFLTMEFVHGCSLAQLQRVLLARKRRLAPAFAARIVMHVAEGLHAAHELCDDTGRLLNVVHRDVTPENILLAYDGQVKLIDFGIAKAYGRRHRTQDGLLKGKFRYMAPEQALSKTIDRRVDIYQLGIVLWEMLTLRRLFAAERDIDLLASVRRPVVQPPSSLVDRIPPALDDAVMAALDPDPRRRPADAQALARMLARAVPAAHDVDAGALRELLIATMSEQRLRERATYPRGVYEGLDAQLDGATKQQLASSAAHATTEEARQAAGRRRLREATLEHTELLGSDSQLAATRRGGLARRDGRAARALRGRRPLELVRFASDLRTSLAQIVEGGFVGSRLYWVTIGAAVGLACALAVITVALRPHERAAQPVPGLPTRVHTEVAPLPPPRPAPSQPEPSVAAPPLHVEEQAPAATPPHVEPALSRAAQRRAARHAARAARREAKRRASIHAAQ
ncbi:MAG: Serine/threonine protein kinase PrkC, regulator of stationary phase [Myxococcaceae bacterium]|nr:Serine/threonine protein kinase PrkC, regulator of stationary phase [Myxococcaceae bacterium]